MADSWKTDGNCAECRRKNYCKKQCSKNKQSNEKLALEYIESIMPNFNDYFGIDGFY